MVCEHDVSELILLLYDEALPAERAALEARLRGCAACRAELAELRRASDLLAALPHPLPSQRVLERLERDLGTRRPGGGWRRPVRGRARTWLGPLAVAATLLAGMAGSLLLRGGGAHDRPPPAAPPALELLAWSSPLDERLEALGRDLDELRPASAGSAPVALDLDERLDELEARIARLGSEPEWAADL